MEEPGASWEPLETTYPLHMCLQLSDWGACSFGACSTGRCVPWPVCVYPVGASVQMCTSEALPMFTIGPSTFFPVARSGLLESCFH